jgi:osmotically-inducible protein OsmY
MNEQEKEIKNRLAWNNEIDESQIEVSVIDGIATLKGCVSTYPEKVLAEIESSMVQGIDSVNNEIDVTSSGEVRGQSDRDVEKAMYCLLDANSEINPNDVKVFVKDGIISLEGKVNSLWKRDKIIKMASQIKGVNSIKNKILVRPSNEIPDDKIWDLISKSLRNSVRIDSKNVKLKVKDGVVTVSGVVSAFVEYEAIIEIIISTNGVTEIKNQLKWIHQYDTT